MNAFSARLFSSMVALAFATPSLIAQTMEMTSATVDGSPGADCAFTLTANAPIRFVVEKQGGGYAESGTVELTGSGNEVVLRVLFTNSGTSTAYQPQVGDKVYMVNYTTNEESNKQDVTQA